MHDCMHAHMQAGRNACRAGRHMHTRQDTRARSAKLPLAGCEYYTSQLGRRAAPTHQKSVVSGLPRLDPKPLSEICQLGSSIRS